MKKILSFILIALPLGFVSCDDKEADYDASGVFEATEVIVSAQGTGEILRMDIAEGATVEAGKTFGFIDTTQLVLRKRQLMASMSANDARRLSETRQTSGIDQQIANLEKERQRFESLLKDGAATQKQVDDIGYQIAVLQKQKNAAGEQVSSANSSLTGQRGSLIAQVRQLNDQLAKSYISSPVAGTVLEKYMEKGEFAAPGKPLFKVADLGTMFLRAYSTAPQLTNLKLGQACTVFADQGTDERKEYKGKIVWISDQAEFTPKTIQTRDERANLVYAVKIAVTNDGLIKRGMYGEVKF